ncbi:MAG: tRNA (guanosine(37)-N1)-methyltransferase TrmD [Myxococcales bacterium]|nr:tRNA (guanosine(37)-N1)-methyltransferase TrmD [Myxococcales bacterium]
MDVYVVALFPELVAPLFAESIVGRAVGEGLLRYFPVQIRDFSTHKHHAVDDTPSGGGRGMVMMAPPVVAAIESVPASPGAPRPRRVLLTPQGRVLNQRTAERLAREPALMVICGRYEGFDERIRAYVDEEISVGDFVLTGGEPAAVVLLDAVVRLVPGVLGKAESAESESHNAEGLLEYPQYTRPVEFRGVKVPEVLSSGHHGRIARWRRWQQLRRTRARRPDLFAKLPLSDADLAFLDGEEP